jgi:hypothetical protein
MRPIEMRARFLFPLIVHISRCKSQNPAPPTRRRCSHESSVPPRVGHRTNLILQLLCHLLQFHTNVGVVGWETLRSQFVIKNADGRVTHLLTCESTAVAFSQLSCLASHLGDSLHRHIPVNRQSAGRHCRARGICQVAFPF